MNDNLWHDLHLALDRTSLKRSRASTEMEMENDDAANEDFDVASSRGGGDDGGSSLSLFSSPFL